MERHFVTFYSPGTFFAEVTELPIDRWDTDLAVKMSRDIVERYGARPYSFRFKTQSRADDDLDSHVTEKSGIYYLGGKVSTLAEIEARCDRKDHILIDNMKCNGWNRVISSIDGWRFTQPLKDGDVVLDVPQERT